MNLTTTYLGIQLKNPLIIGACNLSTDVKTAIELQNAGASAIVFKSLFEEQLHLEAGQLDDDLHEYNDRNAEMTSIFPDIKHSGPKAHLLAIKEVKSALNIPVFASLNCIYNESWEEYALHLQETGIDGIELNFYSTISDDEKTPEEIENEQIEVLKKVKSKIKIPIAIKLSPYYTNPLSFIKKLNIAGADGFVLFNRLFQPDINIEKEELQMPYNLSHKGDNRLSLRYMGLLSGNINGTLCAAGGVTDSEDLIASILAGADSVQMVSAIYKDGIGKITKTLNELSDWMNNKKYASLTDFKGKLAKKT
jgi:dihydroorotate dehydrogenase (fumarate)